MRLRSRAMRTTGALMARLVGAAPSDLMRARVARRPQASLASGAVIPKLAVRARRIVAQIDVSDEAIDGVRRLRIGTLGVASPR